MKEDVRKKWVEALRSGRYEQGQDYLATETGKFCCLGVLCEIAVGEGVIPKPTLRWANGVYRYSYGVDTIKTTQVPPREVWEWAGLSQEVPEAWTEEDGEIELTHLNDNGTPFTEIADIIEAQPSDWEG